MNGRIGRNWGGVYLFRTQRPGLAGRIPLIGRHTAYVGEGHVRSRYRDHLDGSVKYGVPAKPWADLNPSWYFIPLPYWKPLLRLVEMLLILTLWPVYNHQKNLWNPRRIPLQVAKWQRGQRDVIGWSFNLRPGHALLWLVFIGITIMKDGWGLWG